MPTFCLYREPQRGNSGSRPAIIEGWLGTTNDQDAHALGEFDLEDDEELLLQTLHDIDVLTTLEEIKSWSERDEEFDEEYEELELRVDRCVNVESCHYDLSNDDQWWPTLNEGWVTLESYSSGSWGNEGWSHPDLDYEALKSQLHAAGIPYDAVEEHDSSSEMILLNVRQEDQARALAIRHEIASGLLEDAELEGYMKG